MRDRDREGEREEKGLVPLTEVISFVLLLFYLCVLNV